MRSLVKLGLCLTVGVISALGIAAPALADNPACPSGYSSAVVIHIVDTHYRAKGCYNRSTDNFAFQDTYADGWSADFWWPQSADMTKVNLASDKNGAMNGWIYEYENYPSNVHTGMSVCSYDYSAGVDHGCDTTLFYT